MPDLDYRPASISSLYRLVKLQMDPGAPKVRSMLRNFEIHTSPKPIRIVDISRDGLGIELPVPLETDQPIGIECGSVLCFGDHSALPHSAVKHRMKLGQGSTLGLPAQPGRISLPTEERPRNAKIYAMLRCGRGERQALLSLVTGGMSQ
jgi:hypothetical protein